MPVMDLLTLVQKLRQECGIAGTGPSTTLNQVGEMRRLVDWIKEAWIEIQSAHPDWKFNRLSTSWVSIDGQPTYTPLQAGIPADTFSSWIPESFRAYPTAVGTNGEQHLWEISYAWYRDIWLFGANRAVKAPPFEFAIGPDNTIHLGPKPPVGYTLTADYYRAPIDLLIDSDVPSLPRHHNHMIIVWHALMAYGAFESAPEVHARGEREYHILMARLEKDQLPAMGLAGSLC